MPIFLTPIDGNAICQMARNVFPSNREIKVDDFELLV